MVQEARELHKHLPPLGRPVVALFVIHQQFCMLIITGKFCLPRPRTATELFKHPTKGPRMGS